MKGEGSRMKGQPPFLSSFLLPPSSLDSMPRRLAAATSLVAFAFCLVAGIAAENTLATTLSRALAAMGGTLAVGLVVGAMGQKMLDENVKAVKAKAAQAAGEQKPEAAPKSAQPAAPAARRKP